MSSKHRLTRSFRTLSALLYILNISCAIRFMMKHTDYLHLLNGCITVGVALIMFIVAIEAPRIAVEKIERNNNKIGELLFTFRGRYMTDLFLALYLFAMGPIGILLGVSTLTLIFGIRFLGVKQPDAFNEIFRGANTADDPSIMGNNHHLHQASDNYTLESEYDTPVVERR